MQHYFGCLFARSNILKKNILFSIVLTGLCVASVANAESWSEWWLFLKNGYRNFKDNSCCFQTGPHVAKSMTTFVEQRINDRKKGVVDKRPMRGLEVGVGTGTYITKRLVKCLERDDVLYLVEYNDDYCNVLEKKYGNYEHVKIIRGSILDFKEKANINPENDEEKFDFIISTLPMNPMPPAFVHSVFNLFFELITQEGVISYIEVAWLGKVGEGKAWLLGDKDYFEVKRIINEKKRDYEFQMDRVPFNTYARFPRALNHHLSKSKDEYVAKMDEERENEYETLTEEVETLMYET